MLETNPTNDHLEAGLKPEQLIELESIRRDKAAMQAEYAQTKERSEQAKAENVRLRREEAVRDAFLESGIKFYATDIIETLATAQHDVRFDPETGKVTGVLNGERVPLSKVITEIGRMYPTLISDKRTARGLKPESDTSKVPNRPRSEWTMEEKIEYLRHHTDIEYGQVPAYTSRVIEVRTFEDYCKLPQAAKLAFIEKEGVEGIGRLRRKH